MKRITFFVSLLLLICQFSFSQGIKKEVVYLKNGSMVKGVIAELNPDKNLKIITNGSILIFQMSEVDRIISDPDDAKFEGGFFQRDARNSGYRGFVSAGYTFGVGDYGAKRAELMTTHGYKFNPYLFAGIGTGGHLYHSKGDTRVWIPVFADFRVNLMQSMVSPSFGFKIGYTTKIKNGFGFEGQGLYLSPTLGARFKIDRRRAFHIAMGYSLQKSHLTEYEFDYDNYTYYKTVDKNINIGGFSAKVEIEF